MINFYECRFSWEGLALRTKVLRFEDSSVLPGSIHLLDQLQKQIDQFGIPHGNVFVVCFSTYVILNTTLVRLASSHSYFF